MNSKPFIVCLLLAGVAFVVPAQSQILKCQVETVSVKLKDVNGEWTGWQNMENIHVKGMGNVVIDFSKMSMYSDIKALDNGKGLDRKIHINKIVEITHDTTFKEYGFYCIRFKCRDESANLVNYDLLSVGVNNCHSLVLIGTTDKIISKQELVIQ